MRRSNNNPADAIGGQDSFLDIVANLVGILIILVVIVGAQAASVRQEIVATDDLDAQLTEKQTELRMLNSRVDRLTRDNHDLEASIDDEKRLTKQLADERHHKLMMIEQAKLSIESQTANWSEFKRAQFEKQVQIDSLREELTSVHKAYDAHERTEVQLVQAIEHFPTPIAKTVFTDEIHFRLSQGRIAFVPIDELIEQMKAQWNVVSENLRNTSETVSTVGPLNQFRLQYTLRKHRGKRQTAAGLIPAEKIEFDHFLILPAESRIGESVNANLFQDSLFLRHLSGKDPSRTTVSIWVYPDSYSEFMQLKTELHAAGFQVASWPLGEGRPISGGPNGFKTSAQ